MRKAEADKQAAEAARARAAAPDNSFRPGKDAASTLDSYDRTINRAGRDGKLQVKHLPLLYVPFVVQLDSSARISLNETVCRLSPV